MTEPNPILDYSVTPPSRRHITFVNLVIIHCGFAAIACAYVTMGELKEVQYTPAFNTYLSTRAAHPSRNYPPFTGMPFIQHSCWEFPTTYYSIAFVLVAAVLLVHVNRPLTKFSAGDNGAVLLIALLGLIVINPFARRLPSYQNSIRALALHTGMSWSEVTNLLGDPEREDAGWYFFMPSPEGRTIRVRLGNDGRVESFDPGVD